MRTRKVEMLSLLVVAGLACSGGSGPDVADDGGGTDAAVCTVPPCDVEVAVIPSQINRDVDILFMIDNSGSMQEEQDSLRVNFSRFVQVLSELEGGLPNIHVGVVSSDIGANQDISGCEIPASPGILENTPADLTCPVPTDRFISDIANPDGSRNKNYSGTLDETFGCIARLGIAGCGFEQPLEAMRLALNGSNPENGGFLRPNAWLVLVLLTDEDDCSAEDFGMFSNQETKELGPVSSFRCFEFGVVCEPDDPRSVGTKSGCGPREDSAYMKSVQGYVDFFKGLKADPADVIVAGIIGNPSPVNVSENINTSGPQLDPSCSSGAGEAVPGVRLLSFLESFPNRNTASTICNEDLSGALVQVGNLIAQSLGSPCLQGPITMPLECRVEDVLFAGTANEERRELPVCDIPNAPSNLPCYVIQEDLQQCPETETNLVIQVERGSGEGGGDVVVTCKVDALP